MSKTDPMYSSKDIRKYRRKLYMYINLIYNIYNIYMYINLTYNIF